MKSLLAIDLQIEESVEKVEAGDPTGDADPERERRQSERPTDREPGGERCQTVGRPQPEVAEPGRSLQVRVDDERRDRYRPQIANDGRQLKCRRHQ